MIGRMADEVRMSPPTRTDGGDRGGNVRLTCRGRGGSPPLEGAWDRAGVGHLRGIGRSAPVGAKGGRSPEGGRARLGSWPWARGSRANGMGLPRSRGGVPSRRGRRPRRDNHSRGAGSEGAGKAVEVRPLSTGVSVGSVPSRAAPGSSTSSGGTSARASGSIGSGSSGEDDGSSSVSHPSFCRPCGRPSRRLDGGERRGDGFAPGEFSSDLRARCRRRSEGSL